MRTHRATRRPSAARFLALSLAAGLLLALPAAAQADQTLSVSKAGTGTGTVTSSPAGISCGATCSAEFADGEVVLLTGAGGANAQAVKWAGCDAITAQNRCEATMSTAKSVTATFDLVKRRLTVTETGSGTVTSSPAGIDCGATCSAEYDHGTEVTLTGTAGGGSLPVQWSGCTSVSEEKCNVTMSGAKAVTATFALNQVALTVSKAGAGTGTVTSSPAGINCGATCTASFDEGSTVTLTGAPGANTQPAQWSGCSSVNAENKCLVAMSAAKAVSATFNVEGPLLTVTKAGAGTGTVTSSPAGIDCGAACAVNFAKSSTVTLIGAPGPHSEAPQWSGCDSVTGENKCLVAMSAARAVTATFNLQPGYVLYTVSVLRAGTGQGTVTSSPAGIECGAACSAEVLTKTKLTLAAVPAEGSVFDHWSGGGCAGSGPCTATINSSRTVKAVFTAVGQRTLTVTKAGSGAGTVTSKPTGTGIECGPSCTATLPAGTKVTLTAVAAEGSSFAGFSGACTGTGPCKVALNEARNVTATFTEIPVPSSGGRAVIAGAAKVKAGRALVKVLCNGPAGCKGALRLTARLGAKGKSVAIGAASFALAPGEAAMLGVRLSARAKQALRSAGHLKVRVSGAGIHAHAVNLRPQGT